MALYGSTDLQVMVPPAVGEHSERFPLLAVCEVIGARGGGSLFLAVDAETWSNTE